MTGAGAPAAAPLAPAIVPLALAVASEPLSVETLLAWELARPSEL